MMQVSSKDQPPSCVNQELKEKLAAVQDKSRRNVHGNLHENLKNVYHIHQVADEVTPTPSSLHCHSKENTVTGAVPVYVVSITINYSLACRLKIRPTQTFCFCAIFIVVFCVVQ